jgi:hypothetical protein
MRLLAIALSVLVIAGCTGRNREERLYGERAHEIAGDTAPWANAPFRGDQQAWDQQMDQRARLQNEYARIH